MKLNSINAASSYNIQSVNNRKANSQPSFGALCSSAVDTFTKAADERKSPTIEQKDKNTITEALIGLAQRAKQSSVLDIEGHNNTIRLADRAHGVMDETILGSIDYFEKNSSNGQIDCYILSDSSNRNQLEMYDFEFVKQGSSLDVYKGSLKQYMDALTDLFNKKEQEIVYQIDTDKTAEELNEKLASLIVDDKKN